MLLFSVHAHAVWSMFFWAGCHVPVLAERHEGTASVAPWLQRLVVYVLFFLPEPFAGFEAGQRSAHCCIRLHAKGKTRPSRKKSAPSQAKSSRARRTLNGAAASRSACGRRGGTQ